MSSRSHLQLNLPPTEVRSSEHPSAAFRKSEHAGKPDQNDTAELAAALFDEALTRAQLTNKDVAHLLGVSVSMVEKMRSTEARGCPSFAQMLRLPPAFHIEMHRAMNRRFGFGRRALLDLMEAAGTLALVNEL